MSATMFFHEDFETPSWRTHWHERSIEGHTAYERVSTDSGAFLHARSHRTASYLARPLECAVRDYPKLEWRWRVTQPLESEDLGTRRGSDVAARLYALFDTGPLPWQKRLVTYVWSSRLAKGSQLFSAYSRDAGIIVVRDRADLGRWQRESRDLLADYQALFHEEPPLKLDGIALMVDTDNAGGVAEADFDDIILRR